MISEAAFTAEFELQHDPSGTYSRTIEPHWANEGRRIFGGYTAALALNAAIVAAPFRHLCSAHIVFLEPILAGKIAFDVAVLKAGRSLAAMRVTGWQRDRAVLSVQAWLRAANAALVSSEPCSSGSAPEDAVDLSWLAQTHPFHRFLQSRAIDFPSNAQELFEGDDHRTVDIWARPSASSISSTSLAQLCDVLVADAFAGDPHVRMKNVDPSSLVSLDLSIQWNPAPVTAGWRRLQGWAPAADAKQLACFATIFDEQMRVCASVGLQTWSITANRLLEMKR